MSKSKVLVVEDDPVLCGLLRDFLGSLGYKTEAVGTAEQARAAMQRFQPEIAILDYALPDGTALDLIPYVLSFDSELPVFVLTGHGSISLAVESIKLGAEQFLTKPVELSALAKMLDCISANRPPDQRRNSRLLVEPGRVNPFVGSSRKILDLASQCEKVRASDLSTLILGETGSGKGVLAKWLHESGPRSKANFVDLNCAGISRELLETELFGHVRGAFTGAVNNKPGLLEFADGGTLFLDEIGDMDLQIQAKLLKVLEEKRFRRLGEVRDRHCDVRLVAATHANLSDLVRQNKFRADLYFRISTVVLRVPPLRERKEDIPLLVNQIASRVSRNTGAERITLLPSAIAALQDYSWPGNIRELKNVIERASLLSGSRKLGREHLDFGLESEIGTGELMTLEQLERLHIQRVLKQENGKVAAAARRLGIPRSTLYLKLKELALRTIDGPDM
ncbi:MAG TPA: sigma-54 dependent transcriptional regulator [Terriglobales bacterium]|nr:sigma-54 dependent transcriptional regulator [Terriglobales bacterium]